MSAASRLLPLLWLAHGAVAGWLPIGEVPPLSMPNRGTETKRAWSSVQGHRLHPDQGYDGRCLGNLAGKKHLEPLQTARNHALVAPVEAGTPAQRLSCLLDAGSAELWLPSRLCVSCAADAEERRGFFNARESSTFRPWTVLTRTGPSLRMLSMVYGGGSARGLVANETVTLGSAIVPEQAFVLAEDGGQDARQDRSWDGVCGIGRQGSEHGGAPLHERLAEAVFVLSPPPGRSRGVEASRLAVGQVPDELVEPSSTVWVPAAPPDARVGGLWAADASISVQAPGDTDFRPLLARVAFETGTSFLLAPPELYLPLVRSLLPDGAFDELCGVDAAAGNVVVCSCEAQQKVAADISIEFVDANGAAQRFLLHPEDLFDEALPRRHFGHQNGPWCVLQVQQRPLGHAGNLLGSPALASLASSALMRGGDHLQPPSREAGPAKTSPVAEGFLSSPKLPEGVPGAVHEKAVELLTDGTRCESEVVRAANGTVLSAASTATHRLGGPVQLHHLTCAHSLQALLGGGGEPRRRLTPPLLVADGAESSGDTGLVDHERDVWVLGDVFLRRYALLLDFRRARLGLAAPGRAGTTAAAPAMTDATPPPGAAVEAFVSGRPSVAIQTYEQGTLAGGLAADRVRGAAAHLLQDRLEDQAAHVRGAAAHLLGDPVVPEGVAHLRSAAADLLTLPTAPWPSDEPVRSPKGPRPVGFAGLALGSAALCAMALGGLALHWRMARLESASPVMARLVGGEEVDEEAAGSAVE